MAMMTTPSRRMVRHHCYVRKKGIQSAEFAVLLICLLCSFSAAFDTGPAQGVLSRLLQPSQASQFLLLGNLSSTDERFRISRSADSRIQIEASTTSALLVGVNWYLKYVARVHISTNGDRVGTAPFPLPDTTIERSTPFTVRHAFNENVDGYTTPYWDWAHWEREIDVLALSGVNTVLVERGTDMVLYRTFLDFNYTDTEIRGWITQPAHQNWQLMGNMCCFNGPISVELLQKRAQATQQIVARLRELGITPAFPGFYGIVPADFGTRFPKANVVPQGQWVGFTRPGWLDPRDPLYAQLAAAFYSHQSTLFGNSTLYDMEILQEGGTTGNVPVPDAALNILAALTAAHGPQARWMMLAWSGNPRQDLLSAVDRQRLLVVDIDEGAPLRDNRETDFQGAPYLFGGLWAFGGRVTFGANSRTIATRLPAMVQKNANLVGTAVFTEGMNTNPFAFDFFTEMAWRTAEQPFHLVGWTADYVRRRYGAADPHALAAWNALLLTAYDISIDGTAFNSERDAPQESLFNSQPSLTTTQASSWSPSSPRYDLGAFQQILPELLQVAPELRNSEPYLYDLVDVARQTLANEGRLLLPRIKAAYDARNQTAFADLSQLWLHYIDLQDALLASNRFFLVGGWLSLVDAWASSPNELAKLRYDARSILTTWGDRTASESGLHDYGNKDWAGLTADYYRVRWQNYFWTLSDALRTGQQPRSVDWFALGDTWNNGTQSYSNQPTGDSYALAAQIAKEVLGFAAASTATTIGTRSPLSFATAGP